MATERTITHAANRADRNPTDAQKAAGNYRKGHVTIHGMDVTIENARGSRRSGVGHGGRKWSVRMPAHYGYVKGTEGADGDHHDVYVGPVPHSPIVYVIDQKNADTGAFDEHKSMLGFATGAHALQVYHSSFSDGKGPHRVMGVSAMPVSTFKHWISKSKTSKPLSLVKGMKSFAEGGAVEDDEADVPSISWEEAAKFGISQDAKGQGDVPSISWEEAERLGIHKDELPELSAAQSFGVSAARSAIPAAGAVPVGAAGAGFGAMAGAPLAPFTGGLSIPAGMLLGAFGGAYLGGKVANAVQDKALDLAGVKETVDRFTEAAQRQHPYVSFAGDLAPNILAFNFSRAAPVAARVLSGGIMAGQETVMEGLGGEGLDPVKIAGAGAFGAAFSKPTRLGEKLIGAGTRFVPGRPDKQATSAETVADVAADKHDAASSEPPKTAIGASEAMPAPNDSVDVGNPASAAVRSDRLYPKTAPEAEGETPAGPVTVGGIPPDQVSALRDALGVDVTQGDPAAGTPKTATSPGVPAAGSHVKGSEDVRQVQDQGATESQPTPVAGAPSEPPGREAPGEGRSGETRGAPGDQPPGRGDGDQGRADHPEVTPDMFATPDEPTRVLPPLHDPEMDAIEASKTYRAEARAAVAKRQAENGGELFNTPDEPSTPVKDFLADEKGSVSPAQFFKMTTSIGGAFSGPVPHVEGYQARRPSGPEERYSRRVADDLHGVNQQDVGDMVDARKMFEKEMPAIKGDKATQEAIYRAIESGDLSKLTPEQTNFYKAWLEVARKHNDAMYQEIRKYDPTLPNIDPNYMHKMAKGHQTDFEPNLFGADASDPVTGSRGLSKRADALEAPTFMAIEAPNGRRAVISPVEGGFNIWNGYKKTFVKSNADLEMGQEVKIGNARFDIKRADTHEVEANALNRDGKPMEYYKNAALSILKNNVDLRSALRHMQFLEALKENPDFKQYATTDQKVARQNGWEQTKMRQFQGWFMDPHLREVFDDFAKPGLDAGPAVQKIRALSQRVTSTLFWMPVPHALNVFWHWWVGRGWDWMQPTEYRHMAGELTDAWRSVMSQDKLQKQIGDAGAGTIYRSIFANPADFAKNMAQAFGEDVRRNPSRWDPIAKTIGVDPRDLVHGLYRWSSKAMWSFNDVLLTHQVMVNQRKGMDLDQAIKHAERHIPNYRVPARVLGSGEGARFISQVIQDPLFVAFGRYHYGVYNSLAHIAKGLATGTGGERREALGNAFALGLFALVMKPLLDKAAQYITGNPDAETQPRGPMAPIKAARHALEGENINRITRGTVTLPALLSTALELRNNQDFAGRNIVEPGHMQQVVPHSTEDIPNALKHAGAVAVEGAEHVAKGLVSPIGQAASIFNKGQNPAGGVRDLLLDIRNPSDRSRAYELKAPMKNLQQLRSREKNPRGPVEAGYNAAVR